MLTKFLLDVIKAHKEEMKNKFKEPFMNALQHCAKT